ncbi:evC complex member EVC isoform X3 [Synchiropus splendidus]|uniref:evC complex member EVC isoform X3 n=1 Tax=Synchiropus splendidus TaxID=270530 RepID=UPI00237D884D|nr:evC complex member EVC isoform X3 [Synchiropus splendidus]
MSDPDVLPGCGNDVALHFQESSQIYPALLTVATACGALSGVLVAFLLYGFCLKPLILTKQGNDARRLLEPDDGEVENNHSDSASDGKTDTASAANNDEERLNHMNMSDVAAFASRAKVVYPINQKYRPLADGASNPSLHEQSKLADIANEDSYSSSDNESLSQEQDNDGSSQFLSSSLVPKSLQNQTFHQVSHYPHIVTQTGFEGRIGLHGLALQDVQALCCQLQDETFQIFLQSIKMLLTSHFPKDKTDAEFSKEFLQMQQKKVDEFRKQMATHRRESDDAICSLEEVERAQKYFLESGLEVSKSFSKHLEELSQRLLKRANMSAGEAEQATISITKTLLSAGNHLLKMLESDLTRIRERVLWWEELTLLLQSQPALLIQEVTLRRSLLATTQEKLSSDDGLSSPLMEKILQDVQSALLAGLQQCLEDYTKKTNQMVTEKCRKLDAKKKKLQRSLEKEKSHMLESGHDDLLQLTQVYLELLVKHRQQLSDLDSQQDHRMAETLCNLWTKLRRTWSKRFENQAKDVFCSSVCSHSRFTESYCQRLWSDLELEFAAQLPRVEDAVKLQLEEQRVQLDKDQQVWREEMALVQVCLKHLSEQQMKILRSMVVRQNYTINREVGVLVEMKHEHLLVAVQRHFLARHFSLHMLKEMRLSQLKALSQSDFRVLLREGSSMSRSCFDSTFKSSKVSLADTHLILESHLVDQNFHQEYMSELETATEHLQSHAQLVLGNALSRAIERLMQNPAMESNTSHKQDTDFKTRLTEAAAESVYVTKDSLTTVVRGYYSRLQDILETHESTINHDLKLGMESSSQSSKILLRELANWGRKPGSAEFQHRRKMLEHFDREEEEIFVELGRRKIAVEQKMEQLNNQLLGEEEDFLRELASLARVSVQHEELSADEEITGAVNPSILELLALNPALDPALNPSLTPTVVVPVKKPRKKKKERESEIR